MNGPKKIRELFASKKTIVAPGAHDMLTAKIIGRLGFDAVYMTGYGQSASHLGKPDVGLMTMSEMVARAANMVECAGVPVIADADTGFGNAVNVMRTVREYEKAGVAVIQLEDQVMPKKCGHMVGREVIPMEEMVGKIKAAVDARVDPNFMIMARTDARTVHGIDAALEQIGRQSALLRQHRLALDEVLAAVSRYELPDRAVHLVGIRSPVDDDAVGGGVAFELFEVMGQVAQRVAFDL